MTWMQHPIPLLLKNSTKSAPYFISSPSGPFRLLVGLDWSPRVKNPSGEPCDCSLCVSGDDNDHRQCQQKNCATPHHDVDQGHGGRSAASVAHYAAHRVNRQIHLGSTLKCCSKELSCRCRIVETQSLFVLVASPVVNLQIHFGSVKKKIWHL